MKCVKFQALRFKQNLFSFAFKVTNHNFEKISSFAALVDYLYRPVDGSSIAVARILFGIVMLIDIPDERGGSELDTRWGRRENCYFPLFNHLKSLELSRMILVYGIMWIGALGIALGFRFRITSLMFVLSYWYVFLLDKSVWNNHSYLYGLCGILYASSSAHNCFSLDACLTRQKTNSTSVPFWNYFVLKYQFFILYSMAGIKKLSPEWLAGYAMENLSYHWVFVPFRLCLGTQLTDFIIVHWFTCLFDLTIMFWIIYQPTRLVATAFCTAFHLMNSQLFSIGMFPWLCLTQLPLFYQFNWPVKLGKRVFNRKLENSNLATETISRKNLVKRKIVVFLLMCYCLVQLFLPFSHFITKGFNNWTDGIYGYSWDMMVHAWDTILIVVKVVDNGNGKVHYLDPLSFTQNDRWTKHVDMAYQYVKCINQNLIEDFRSNKNTLLSSSNFSIYLDVWCSLNGRFQQRMFDPNVDILKATWSPFQRTTWAKPLLSKFTSLRPQMQAMAKEVIAWTNKTDVLFVADFPHLQLDNYVSPELENVTLTVLDGTVMYESKEQKLKIESGKSVRLMEGLIHRTTTISELPSCYMYTYLNKTLPDSRQTFVNQKSILTLILDHVSAYFQKYNQFFESIRSAIMYEMFDVPIAVRQKI